MKSLDINKLIQFGLYLLVFLLPLQTRWILRSIEVGGWDYAYGTIGLYAVDILLLALLALFAWERRKVLTHGSKSALIPRFWLFLAGLELVIFVSILVARDMPVAIYGYANFLLGIGLLWIILYGKYSYFKMTVSYLAGALLQAGAGIWQFLSQSDFSSKWLGTAMHSPGEMGASVVETLSGGRWLRAYGTLDHPNILGGYLAIAILLAAYLYLYKKKKTNKPDNNHDKKVKAGKIDWQAAGGFAKKYEHPVLLGVIAVLFIALFFSFSRTAWAGLLIGLIIFLAVSFYQRHKPAQIQLIKLVVILAVLSGTLFVFYHELVLSRLSQDTYTEIKSANERISSYEIASGVIRKNLFLGSGIRNYGLETENILGQEMDYYVYQPVHNVFLLVLAEIGLLGLIFFVAVLQYVFSRIYSPGISSKANAKQQSVNQGPYQAAFLFAVLAMFLFDHWWWSLHFGVLLFWFIIGIVLRNAHDA
jgi:O-antigen ligase